VRPDVPIVWGGYHSSLGRHAILEEGWADYVVRGPGEPAIIPLARILTDHAARGQKVSKKLLRSVPNLSFRDIVGVVDTSRANPDMEVVPRLDYELIRPERYYGRKRRNISYITSYGCPWRCSYCAEPTHSRRAWRSHDATRIATEITDIWERYAPSFIDLVDPNFSSSTRRVEQVVDELEALGTRASICCNMRATDVVRLSGRMDLGRLRNAGFRRIFLGLESGSNRLLRGILQKDSCVEDAREACRLLDAAGIEQFSSFIHDIPTETPEDSEETINLAREIASYEGNRQFHHFFIPFPNTALYQMLLAQADPGFEKIGGLRDWARARTRSAAGALCGRVAWTSARVFSPPSTSSAQATHLRFADRRPCRTSRAHSNV
jgi:anaerobic magnesium-protoporphyrin IX monomethyl ester cyclase